MKRFGLLFVIVSSLLLSSCAGGYTRPSPVQPPVAVASPTDANRILSCLVESQKISRMDFKAEYKTVSTQAAGGTDAATMRLICLSLHEYASYKQFKAGMTTLANYIKEHPDATDLQGIHGLLQRIDREMTGKWSQYSQSNKNLDEKEKLENANKELVARNEALETAAAQDQERIRELHVQIEQLKHIENIIKKRER